MRSDPEERAFLEALEDNVYDEATRKVYADWLDEHDRPEEADFQRRWSAEKYDAAWEFMEAFASECETDAQELVDGARDFLDTGEWYCLGVDSPDCVYSRQSMSRFWEHFHTLTGRRHPGDDEKGLRFIRCAC